MVLVQLLNDEKGFKLANGIYIPEESLKKKFDSAILFISSDKLGISTQISGFVERYTRLYGIVNSFYFGSRAWKDNPFGYNLRFFMCTLPDFPEQKVEDYQLPDELLRMR